MSAGVPSYSHIVVVIEENQNYNEIAGNSQAPFINSLMQGGANLTNYSALLHPSQPNYFALYAGSTFGTTDDNSYSEPDPTLYTVLKNAGLTFSGFVDGGGGGSDFNHDPWVSFPEGYSVQTDFTSFPSLFPNGNYSSLPSVSYVIPSITNDMHSGTVAQADTWLQQNLGAYATWAKANNSLLVVVWDESDDTSSQTTNQVPAILYGANITPGNYNTAYNPYNLLATIADAFNVTAPNNAATAAPITGMFGSTGTAAPVLSGAGNTVTYTGGGAAVAVDSGLTISDASSPTLDSATVTIAAGLLAGDTLSFTPQSGITGSYNASTGVLTLSGNASLAAYQAALDSVVYYSTGSDATGGGAAPSRTISWTVTGAGATATANSTITMVNIVPSSVVHANDISHSGDVTGPYNFIDLLNLEAGYSDLIHAFGANQQAMQAWYNANEPLEKRPDTFDGLDYIASYGDLINAFKSAGSEKAVLDAGAMHFITNGMNEGRATTFNGLDYIASYGDLIKAFGENGDAGAYHYIEYGASEGRTTSFDGLEYIASYSDLIKAFGANEQAGAEHFIQSGYNEGRTTTFDGLDYIAGYADLMQAFGADADAGATHYINNGLNEGRSAQPFNVAAYESAHPDLIGKYANNDAFLTAYINNYVATGQLLT